MAEEDLVRHDGTRLCVGDRIMSDGYYATVKFIGDVFGTNGLWLGVEWDDSSRGKHSGMHNNVAYFQTSHSNAGSFIRAKKVHKGVNYYQSLWDCYSEMWSNGDICTETFEDNQIKIKTPRHSLGVENLLNVTLYNQLMYGLGTNTLWQQLPTNIVDLNLCKNLLSSWESVVEITRSLPHLKSLNVSQNRLAIPKNPETVTDAFCNVRILVLHRMNYSWKEILECSRMFKGLEFLSVCFNSLHTISLPDSCLENLQLLELANNEFQEWSEILKFGRLPKLESLLLDNNSLGCIHFLDTSSTGQSSQNFEHLRNLYLCHNRISEWSSINELNKLKRLEDIHLADNPLMDLNTPQTARQIVIAKIAKLKRCYKTEITAKERRGSEIDYLKMYGEAWLMAGGNPDPKKNNPSLDFITEHPRYQELVNKYGAPEESEFAKKPKTLKENLITVTITCPLVPERASVQKKLPCMMTVQKLKALVQRLFKDNSSDLKLSYISERMQDSEIQFDNDLRELYYYSIENGDTILVRW